MRGVYTKTLVLAVLFCWCPIAVAQEEVVPPEERDTIEADEDLPDEIPGGDEIADDEPKERVSPTSGGRTQAEEEHTVVPGDTLWDLCATYLNNPWYWPRVWSYNPEITNPHWIYPGQAVRFYPGGELPSEILVSDQMDLPEMVDEDLEDEVPDDLISWAAGKDIIRAKRVTSVKLQRDAFITVNEVEDLGFIRASRTEKKFLAEYDPIYIEFKNMSAVQVGQQYMIIRTIKEVFHPITDESEGFYTRVMGAAQIVHIDDKVATAIIATSLDPIFRGDRVVPVNPQMTKHIGPRPNSVELKGYILDSRIELTQLGERLIVFIDQGTEDGVQEGNVFDIVRREDGFWPVGERRPRDYWNEDLPIEVFGRILIVDARPTASTGMVMASLREVNRGDRVLMAPK